MSEVERTERLKTLLAQRDVAMWRGMPNSVAAIDRELRDLVKDAAPPQARAVTR